MHIPTLYGSKISCQKKSSNEIHARYMCSYAREGRRGKNVMLLTLARNNMLLSSTRCAAFHLVLFCILLLFASLVHNTTIMILWWHSSRRMWPCAACHCRNLLLPISYWNGSFYFYHSTTIAKYLCQISGYMLGQQRDICRRRSGLRAVCWLKSSPNRLGTTRTRMRDFQCFVAAGTYALTYN